MPKVTTKKPNINHNYDSVYDISEEGEHESDGLGFDLFGTSGPVRDFLLHL